jgi:hypothetical protein
LLAWGRHQRPADRVATNRCLFDPRRRVRAVILPGRQLGGLLRAEALAAAASSESVPRQTWGQTHATFSAKAAPRIPLAAQARQVPARCSQLLTQLHHFHLPSLNRSLPGPARPSKQSRIGSIPTPTAPGPNSVCPKSCCWPSAFVVTCAERRCAVLPLPTPYVPANRKIKVCAFSMAA